MPSARVAPLLVAFVVCVAVSVFMVNDPDHSLPPPPLAVLWLGMAAPLCAQKEAPA